MDDLGTPNAALADALAHTDASIGLMVSELAIQGLTLTTAIIITAKHGESSLDPSKRVVQLNSAIQTVLTSAGAEVTLNGSGVLTVSGLSSERVVATLTSHAVPFSEVTAHRATLEQAYMELTSQSVEYRAEATS